MITARRALVDDAALIAGHQALDDPHPRTERELRSLLARSTDPWVIFWEDQPACVFGVIPDPTRFDEGTLWMQVTAATRKHPMAWARETLKGWRVLQGEWRRLYGMVPEECVSVRRFHKRLGFQHSEPFERHGRVVRWYTWERENGRNGSYSRI